MNVYPKIIRPILFRINPERIHEIALRSGQFFGRFWIFRTFFRLLYSYSHPSLETSVCGIHFKNPIGLAAGFDYDAQLTQIIPCVGFGAETIGSITYGSYEGNKKPRLARLPKSRSLLVNKGLKNKG